MKFTKLHTYIEDVASLFALVQAKPWAQWLDSGFVNTKAHTKANTDKSANHGDVDIMVFAPAKTLVTRQGITEVEDLKKKSKQRVKQDPFEVVAREIEPYKTQFIAAAQEIEESIATLFAPIFGGAFGFFSYELGRYIENLPNTANNDIEMPDMALGLYEVVLLTSHELRQSWLIDITGDNQAIYQQWLDIYQNYLERDSELLTASQATGLDNLALKPWSARTKPHSNYSRRDYEKKFNQVKQYLNAGDAYQINLTKRFQVEVEGDAYASYCNMRGLSAAPFGAYMHFPFAKILSNSPEQFIECDGAKVLTSPIKGTMPRDKQVLERDLELAESLEKSEKDRAENLMIVDLMRNDLGRVCEIGSVDVPKLFGIESYANVHHMVSHIRGRLRKGFTALDLLRACFPGGSITGAPKKRAMEIIDELEPTCRGVYCGAIGWVGFGGNMQTNIAIRTITNIGNTAYFSAGGGIVMDSDVDAEYQELNDKALIMRKIVGGEE